MEVYAGFMAHTDHHVGRLIDTIEDLGVLDDTLVYYIVGDNGASAEGTVNGTFNEMLLLNGASAFETVEFMASKVDLFGGPEAYNHYAVGWAHAMDTPYQWTKQVASHWGGTRNGTIVHWPNGFAARGEIRPQFCHVIDVAPTVLEAAGLPAPTFVHGVQQMPLQGTSMIYSFDDADAAGAPRPPVLRDVRQPRHLPPGLDRVHPAHHAMGDRADPADRRRRVGAVRPRRLDAGPQHRRPRTRRSSPSCNGCSSSRPPSTTCCRSTTAASSGSTPTSPAGRSSSEATHNCCSGAWDGCRRTRSS